LESNQTFWLLGVECLALFASELIVINLNRCNYKGTKHAGKKEKCGQDFQGFFGVVLGAQSRVDELAQHGDTSTGRWRHFQRFG